ncbi:hypothetical protein COV61_04545 [Candidatus Micrarchaeota archaeon CG11_big_fil_rev_8_21_14_0_20_47_5]|nr:MAG: hypothetical protein AUJ17_02965 [Candidatus Micrarchaeota archaeon CG1_02_47_40]PIN82945.1 MAG: hypothetical protein COV61_04545 [Candidatus Micrarchaeota archaeon CG11_big_fil_rev_8_21_14_0_20_47_5]
MQITESADNVQAGISALIGGIVGGLLGGLCCCLLQIFGGAISAAALRFQHGGPISLKDGAVIGALGGLVAGIFGGMLAGGVAYMGYSWLNLIGVVSDKTILGAVGFVLSVPAGILLGALGGVLVAKIYQ